MSRSMAPVQYYGGKGKMVAKLRRLVPPGGRPYCEPYCGGASLFFAREPAPVEVLNDLDKDLVNLFRCIQDRELCEELEHRIFWTLYSRAEFERALEIRHSGNGDAIIRAWAFYVTQNHGFGGREPRSSGDWGRNVNASTRGMAHVTSAWTTRQGMFHTWHQRLMRVQIDCRDALEVIAYWDNPEAVFYVDPPYVAATMVEKRGYRHEVDDEHHRLLVETLLKCHGAVTLSGYDHEIYRPLEEAGWQRVEFETACHAAGRTRASGLQGTGNAMKHAPRREVVWLNQKAAESIGCSGGLFRV